ncbi:uncharacterized protein GIQ15_02316 [Arthroderma uncinatum]|uniref:uncharacterized protein n=1 Tax=Arthroderma uncinatum TaxID=74035 RepID=UPI00144A9F5B|nr:uncharacterized protein GIQ15_02316 [Arthroderma uncinatum]KAF3482992.1 hypothetical protein GIQ15_02316 [Arthroderma uncinatum]
MVLFSTSSGGTGSSLAKAAIIVAGVASLVASLISLLSIWLQTKNYRKPLLQRYVVRILLMVPIFAISSWTSIVSLKAAAWVSPVRDIYEAFTIYTFFQLLINFLGGERSLIIMTHGRPPIQHTWPLNQFLPKIDISDPYTFLAIKRGILQYAWLKPILALITIILKATGTFQEGYIGLSSGYLWIGIIYNLSVTISLYSLALYWIIMHDDLKPYRPVPKFLSVKLIIFASYWQGFFLSILQFLGAIPHGPEGYTPNNMAAAIQDLLICCEMPIFALMHWYAFSWHDYADSSISSARMPVKYAIRDAFGVKDLIEDTKETFRGEKYQYRFFDSETNVIAHEESRSRMARVMDGMRYERGGKAKYWIPKPKEVNSRTPLLDPGSSSSRRESQASSSRTRDECNRTYDIEEPTLNEDDELCFTNARKLEFGDWNYPVITTNEVYREQVWQRQTSQPSINSGRTASSEGNKIKRPGNRQSKRQQRPNDRQPGSSSNAKADKAKQPAALTRESSRTSESSSASRQLADLVDGTDEAPAQRTGDQLPRDTRTREYTDEQPSMHPAPHNTNEVPPRLNGSENLAPSNNNTHRRSDGFQHDGSGPGTEGYSGVFDDEHDAWNTSGATR